MDTRSAHVDSTEHLKALGSHPHRRRVVAELSAPSGTTTVCTTRRRQRPRRGTRRPHRRYRRRRRAEVAARCHQRPWARGRVRQAEDAAFCDLTGVLASLLPQLKRYHVFIGDNSSTLVIIIFDWMCSATVCK